MTPTDEIRAKLDERGIKYTTDDSNDYEIVEWQGPYNLWWQFVYDPYEEAPYGDLRLLDTGGSTHLTPAQAIAVTVGEEHEMHICKRCGVAYELNIIDKGFGKPRFCPNCGYRELYQ